MCLIGRTWSDMTYMCILYLGVHIDFLAFTGPSLNVQQLDALQPDMTVVTTNT